MKDAPNPCLKIDGLGLIGLPLSKRDAAAIKSYCMPYDEIFPSGRCWMMNRLLVSDEVLRAKCLFLNSSLDTFP